MSSLANYITCAQDQLSAHPTQRAGQAAYNALASFDPGLAAEITGTEYDPFHNNAALPAFWQYVAERLAE